MAPESCPDAGGYSRHVRTRSSTLSFERSGAPDSVEVRVEPTPEAGGWVGRVTITGPRALDREVRGERCEDVVAALALITVLRLEGDEASAAGAAARRSTDAAAGLDADSSASGRSSGATAPSAPVASASPPSEPSGPAAAADNPAPVASEDPTRPADESPESSTPEAPAAEASVPGAAERVEPAASDANPSDEPRAAARARESTRASSPEGSRAPERRARASTEGALESAPSAADAASVDDREPSVPSEPWQWPKLGVGVALQAGYASVPAHAFKGLVQGELRLGEGMSSWATTLSFAYARGTREVDVATLGITLLTAELALCPPAFIDATRVWVRACADVRGGRVRFRVTANDPGQEPGIAWRPWLAVGPSMQLGVPLGDRWALRGAFDLAVQLIRDRFNVERQIEGEESPEELILYRPESVSFEFGLGLGYSF